MAASVTAAATMVAPALSRWLAPVTTADPGHRAVGTVTAHHFGYVRMLRCTTGPLRLVRDAPTVSDGSGDAVALLVQRGGVLELSQDGRTARVSDGQLALVDLRGDFSLTSGADASYVLFRLPVHALYVSAGALRSVTARVFTAPGGLAVPLPALLSHLERTALRDSPDHTPAAVRERLGGLVTDLVAALVDEAGEAGDVPSANGPGHLVAAVRAYIDRQLGDPDLSAEQIAAAHRISVRYLHRLFEGEGVTVGRLIQSRRVERCAEELARRGRVGPSLAVVAARWGFRSAAHFSRAFKAVHGYPPEQWRRRVSAGELPAGVLPVGVLPAEVLPAQGGATGHGEPATGGTAGSAEVR
ncbi:helix-turn-helix domain-containing protein [Streptomyces sp. NPDC004111]|uniref:helix-turn-helix domain-containing protein n=1 Tax=Streptomyces sp. NPDC004111 TaxID=3364690 RepID=UPI0036A4331E